MTRGPLAEVSLPAIAHNLRVVRSIVGTHPVIAVVKANAYGHGSVEVSKRLLREGVSFLAVAYTDEAIELRDAGIDSPIIVLFDGNEVGDFFDFSLTPVIYSLDVARALSAEAERRGTSIKVHVKIDTGMGRLGLSGGQIVRDLVRVAEMPGVELDGLLSHFSEADLSDRAYADSQLAQFAAVREGISAVLKRNLFSHIANSAAVLSFENAYFDAVRPGLMLYGHSPLHGGAQKPLRGEEGDSTRLIPAMKIKARLLCIRNVPAGTPISYGRTFITKRQSRIGVMPLGYADGFSRSFSNNCEVLLRGRRVPVVGRVCMDLTMIDLTEIGEAEVSDEITLLGTQGNETITADELAGRANTISYEILTSLGNRSKRTYVETH